MKILEIVKRVLWRLVRGPWRVLYDRRDNDPDDAHNISEIMTWRQARDYASMFGGTVHPTYAFEEGHDERAEYFIRLKQRSERP